MAQFLLVLAGKAGFTIGSISLGGLVGQGDSLAEIPVGELVLFDLKNLPLVVEILHL